MRDLLGLALPVSFCQHVVLTQQQMQVMKQMEARGLPPPPPPPPLQQQQQISLEQQQLYYKQQLDENQGKYQESKQLYEQQSRRLETMEWNSHEQQFDPEQQQQIETFCGQFLNNLWELRKQKQELHGQQFKLILKAEAESS